MTKGELMALSKKKLLDFIKEKIRTDELNEKTLLFSTGNLDSVSQLDLILFIESEAGITVDQLDVTLENFDSIEHILKFVSSKNGRIE